MATYIHNIYSNTFATGIQLSFSQFHESLNALGVYQFDFKYWWTQYFDPLPPDILGKEAIF